MTEASARLLELARRVSIPYVRLGAEAMMVTGSTALGLADNYSDIDMTAYWRRLPGEEELAAARLENGAAERAWLLGNPADGSFAEAYRLDGVEVQIGQATVDTWERDMAAVLAGEEIATPLHKALSGTLICIPLHGEELIGRWKETLRAFPPELGRKMVEHYLQFFPLWGMIESLGMRDAAVWRQGMLVEAAQNLLGVLAGLNRLYYSSFQFKHMRHLISQMSSAPLNLAERIEALFQADHARGALELERLVAETVALVEAAMPEVDTTAARRRLGWRQQPWGAPAPA